MLAQAGFLNGASTRSTLHSAQWLPNLIFYCKYQAGFFTALFLSRCLVCSARGFVLFFHGVCYFPQIAASCVDDCTDTTSGPGADAAGEEQFGREPEHEGVGSLDVGGVQSQVKLHGHRTHEDADLNHVHARPCDRWECWYRCKAGCRTPHSHPRCMAPQSTSLGNFRPTPTVACHICFPRPLRKRSTNPVPMLHGASIAHQSIIIIGSPINISIHQ